MNVAILGYNTEGRLSYDYFVRQGHAVTICDQNAELEIPDGATAVLGEAYLDDLDRFDLLVRTAGMPAGVILEKNPGVADKITSQINEFLRVCPTKNIIGVTGTKGKGTTSTMIHDMLQADGKTVFLGGNIGIPVFSFLDELTADSWVVLELSSFQLSDLQTSPHIAVCLMVVPEHLNWHADFGDYREAKSHLFAQQTADDIAIYFDQNGDSRQIAAAGKATKLPYFAAPGAHVVDGKIVIDNQTIVQTSELKLLGEHNWQNVCAAVTAVWQVTQNVEAIRSVLTSFTGLPHRIEFVRTYNDIDFYNDSFATGLHATEAAIAAIPGKKVVIMGGYERMIDLDHFGDFANQYADDLRTLLIIGESAQRLAAVLAKAGFDNYVIDESAKTMEAVVAKAISLAQPHDTILLSPGFASYDMFKNFEDRGLQFKAVVNSL